jgi:hypothetical protein
MLGCFNQSVLYRVVVNVIDMGIIILLVPYLMFPKSSLPDAPLPMSYSGSRRCYAGLLNQAVPNDNDKLAVNYNYQGGALWKQQPCGKRFYT